MIEDYFKKLEEALDSYSKEEMSKRLDEYGSCENGVMIGDFIANLEERIKNFYIYGNSWTNEELELILKEKNE